MKTAKIEFHKCIQDSQEYGSDDEHMVSRVFFTFELDEKKVEMNADIKQIAGGSYDSDPIEVRLPLGIVGDFNYKAFCEAVESYYRSIVGSNPSFLVITGSSNMRMRNNEYGFKLTFEFPVDENGFAW